MDPQPCSVCLFCGSRTGDDPRFTDQARLLGAVLARRGHRLVYGAGDRGLMGEAARAMQQAGGRILGVVPQHLVEREAGGSGLDRGFDEYFVVGTMHERKKLMFDRSDAVVALPGGTGTLDELIEVLTWRQLGLHARPVVLVDTGGYWQPLLALLDHIIAHGFAEPRFRSYYEIAADVVAAVDRVEALLGKNITGHPQK